MFIFLKMWYDKKKCKGSVCMKLLLVIDMQNDFISGALGTKEAQAIVEPVEKLVREFDGEVLFTRDTHDENYLATQEGKNLPVVHCVRGTQGWQIADALLPYTQTVFDKPTFGSPILALDIVRMHENENLESITLCGLCTDICVISNAMLLKAFLPEVPIFVQADCCAGVTPQSHENALGAMAACQIGIIR